jgi:hypothetical protein
MLGSDSIASSFGKPRWYSWSAVKCSLVIIEHDRKDCFGVEACVLFLSVLSNASTANEQLKINAKLTSLKQRNFAFFALMELFFIDNSLIKCALSKSLSI